jgi:uncharacterized OsmC-like protein
VVKLFHADGAKDLNDESKHRFIGQAGFELCSVLTSLSRSVTVPVSQSGEYR